MTEAKWVSVSGVLWRWWIDIYIAPVWRPVAVAYRDLDGETGGDVGRISGLVIGAAVASIVGTAMYLCDVFLTPAGIHDLCCVVAMRRAILRARWRSAVWRLRRRAAEVQWCRYPVVWWRCRPRPQVHARLNGYARDCLSRYARWWRLRPRWTQTGRTALAEMLDAIAQEYA